MGCTFETRLLSRLTHSEHQGREPLETRRPFGTHTSPKGRVHLLFQLETTLDSIESSRRLPQLHSTLPWNLEHRRSFSGFQCVTTYASLALSLIGVALENGIALPAPHMRLTLVA